jgi:hemicentin
MKKRSGISSRSSFLNKAITRFNYQANEESTAREIESVFRRAIENLKFSRANRIFDEISVVFIDEGGLPKELKNAMKVIHYFLDHPEVPAVILTNQMLDAAKTNRAIQVQQGQISFEDLETLAKGSFFSGILIFSEFRKILLFWSSSILKGNHFGKLKMYINLALIFFF